MAAVISNLSAAVDASEPTYGQQVVAAVLLAEARSEGREGMLAVAEVIRNRADDLHWSPLAVVKQEKQFSCMNQTTPPEMIKKFRGHALWPLAIEIARTTYNQPESLPGITRGATHYDHGNPAWANGQSIVAVIGTLKFYRMPVPR